MGVSTVVSLNGLRALIIGAGDEQVFFIEEAQKLGIYVIAMDENPLAKGLTIANKGYCLDIKNESEVIKIAKECFIDFVMPAPIGNLITTIGAVNDALNLKGVTKEQAELFSSKEKFKKLKHAHHFYNPKEITIKNPDMSKIQKVVGECNCRCVLRPSKGAGSRGVVVVEKEDTALIREHLDALLPTEYCLVSEFVQGIEYGIDLLILDEIHVLSIRQKMITNIPYRQEVGFTIVNDGNIHQKVKMEFEKLVHITNLSSVMMHADVIINGESVFIVEASPRPSGLGIYPNLLSAYYIEPIVQECISMILNEKSTFSLSHTTSLMGLYFWDLPNKQITRIIDYKAKGIIKCKYNLSIGEEIPLVKQGADIYNRGYFLLKSERKKDLLDLREKILDSAVQ